LFFLGVEEYIIPSLTGLVSISLRKLDCLIDAVMIGHTPYDAEAALEAGAAAAVC
jgi:hypothetical protein